MPFGQIDGGHDRHREGTGLGLPIAKALIELHGGQLSIASEQGRRHHHHRAAADRCNLNSEFTAPTPQPIDEALRPGVAYT